MSANNNGSMVFYDETYETPKGDLRVQVDFARVVDDIQRYTDKLMISRNLPFDLQNLSPVDPSVLFVTSNMLWIEDSEQVLETVRKNYELHISRANSDATILALTRLTPSFQFDPEPYPQNGSEADEWDVQIPEPVKNLQNPIERRLKQVKDVLSSDMQAFSEFSRLMQTIFVEVQRRLGKTDEDGFRVGRSGGNVSAKAVSRRSQPKVRKTDSGVESLSGRDGDSQPAAEGGTTQEAG